MSIPYRQTDLIYKKEIKFMFQLKQFLKNWLPDSFQFVRRWKGGHWEKWGGFFSSWFQTKECLHDKNMTYAEKCSNLVCLNFYRPSGGVTTHYKCEDWSKELNDENK